ncbi:uncharacterized protein G2W53_029794 [Senna tora]|uniref:Retrotransposon Copia-like N-terminal domain-containing protein n=1 Tax=Senna tora TaxID=362788 RepID=A0A834W9Z4_9FABA|nr:uncharacterized protein G2W53_029794 [Senna tora]
MALVNTVLDGRNYWAWSIGVKTALEAKDKIGFIDGSMAPPKDAEEFKKWKKVDSMIKSWLTNSISKEISDLFIFCLSSKALWDILEERYGFLMGLTPSYDVIRSQILHLTPLPSVNKAYAMVISDETQRQVNLSYSASGEGSSAMMVKGKNDGSYSKKKEQSKKDKYCDHCRTNGHTRDTCFKIHGYPERFKEMREKIGTGQKKQMVNLTNEAVADTPVNQEGESNAKGDLSNMVAYLMKEVQKLSKNKAPKEEHVNFVNLHDFAGNILTKTNAKISGNTWIIDTGATSHMCSNASLMNNLRTLAHPRIVHLPDKSKKRINSIGLVTLNPQLTLKDVLFIPSFKYNLLSVNRLAKDNNISFIFDSTSCMLQGPEDSHNDTKLAEKTMLKTDECTVKHGPINNKVVVTCAKTNDHDSNQVANRKPIAAKVWHFRLGHASMNAIKHINQISVSDLTNNPSLTEKKESTAPTVRLPVPVIQEEEESYSTDGEPIVPLNDVTMTNEQDNIMQPENDICQEPVPEPLPQNPMNTIRSSSRSRKNPAWMQDYVCMNKVSEALHQDGTKTTNHSLGWSSPGFAVPKGHPLFRLVLQS